MILILLWMNAAVLYAQNDKEQARELGAKGIRLVDKGEYEEGIKLFEQAQKLDPKSSIYAYEIAYAWYLKKHYTNAIRAGERLVKRKDTEDSHYQLPGNCYDLTGDRNKAIKTYQKGLEMFPGSGPLYLEPGVVTAHNEDYTQALAYWEKGIQVAPCYSSNYFHAARMFAGTSEKYWALAYGEMFMNLEPGTKRTGQISQLLADTYKKCVTIKSDTSASVNFTSNVIAISSNSKGDDLVKALSQQLVRFENVYATDYTIALGITAIQKKLDSLSWLTHWNNGRHTFTQIWFKNNRDKKFPMHCWISTKSCLRKAILNVITTGFCLKVHPKNLRITMS